MSDRELLELAAKAAGISATWHYLPDADYDAENDGMWLNGERSPDNSAYWNPLHKDGDALRLAVKLELDIAFINCDTLVINVCEGGDDPFKRTRRAIVRAAAAIGEAMP